jgi:hypothetical protein
MAIPKKGSRKIMVDGRRFRWFVRRKPSYSQALGESLLSFAVELADQPAQVLHVYLDAARPDAWINAGPVTISPGLVAVVIRQAVRDGWMPETAGPTFVTTARLDRTHDENAGPASSNSELAPPSSVAAPSARPE